MNELVTYETYEQFKSALDKEILSAAESFVKIGYLLKQARDTTILYESGYANLYEFAKAEYGIDKGTVSRYIAINDRFSVGGNAPALEDKYSGRGVTKLQEMLTMSDEVIDVIPEETTKSELRDIKRDIKAEQEITDIEVMLEEYGTPNWLDTMAKQALFHFLKGDKQAFNRVHKVYQNGPIDVKEVVTALVPSGTGAPRTRVPKVGTILISIQGEEVPAQFVNVRSNEKASMDWQEIISLMKEIVGIGTEVAARYELLYGEPFEVAKVKENIVPEVQSKKAVPAQPKIKPLKENVAKPKQTVKVEVVPGVEAEIVDVEKALQAARNEEYKAKVETIGAPYDFEEADERAAVADLPTFPAPEEVQDDEKSSVSAEEHNRYMQLADDIKDALFNQDYKGAKSKAETLAALLGAVRV